MSRIRWGALLVAFLLLVTPLALQTGLILLGASARQLTLSLLLIYLGILFCCRLALRRLDKRRQISTEKEAKNRLLKEEAQHAHAEKPPEQRHAPAQRPQKKPSA